MATDKYKVVRVQIDNGTDTESKLVRGGLGYGEALQLAIDKAEGLTTMLQRSDAGWTFEPHDDGASIFYYEDVKTVFSVEQEDV